MMRHVHSALSALGSRKDRGAIIASAVIALGALFASYGLGSGNGGGPVMPVIAAPALTDFMPAGAVTASAAVTVPDLPQPGYAFVYTMNGKAFVRYIAWSKADAAYSVVGTVALPVDMLGVPTLSVVHPGSGMNWVELQVPGPASGDQVLWVMPTPAGLSVVSMTTKDGAVEPAVFVRGASVTHTEDVRAHDVQGNGTAGVEAISTELGEDGVRTSVRAFVWNGDRLLYDADISDTLTSAKALFRD